MRVLCCPACPHGTACLFASAGVHPGAPLSPLGHAQALLDEYLFWQDEATEPPTLAPGEGRPGYKKLRGYPVDPKGDSIVVVEIQPLGSWEAAEGPGALAAAAAAAASDGSSPHVDVVEATGFPGRSLRVLRRPKATAAAEFGKLKAVAAELERLRLLRRPDRRAKRVGGGRSGGARAGKGAKDKAAAFKVRLVPPAPPPPFPLTQLPN